jgi:hypothetical protein
MSAGISLMVGGPRLRAGHAVAGVRGVAAILGAPGDVKVVVRASVAGVGEGDVPVDAAGLVAAFLPGTTGAVQGSGWDR